VGFRVRGKTKKGDLKKTVSGDRKAGIKQTEVGRSIFVENSG
jgi:hypothetical protein